MTPGGNRSQSMPSRNVLAVIVAVLAASQGFAQDQPPPKKIAVPYGVDHAKPLDAKEEVVTQADDHTQYRVEFTGIKNDRVPAYLYVPKQAKAPLPAILLQYGSGGNK